MENKVTLTERETTLLHYGLMALMRDAGQAGTLAAGADIADQLKAYTDEIRDLNTKICNA